VQAVSHRPGVPCSNWHPWLSNSRGAFLCSVQTPQPVGAHQCHDSQHSRVPSRPARTLRIHAGACPPLPPGGLCCGTPRSTSPLAAALPNPGQTPSRSGAPPRFVAPWTSRLFRQLESQPSLPHFVPPHGLAMPHGEPEQSGPQVSRLHHGLRPACLRGRRLLLLSSAAPAKP